MVEKLSYQIADGAIAQEIAGESVILDLTSESYFGLNEVGTRIWSGLAEGLDNQGILNLLVEEYDAPAQVLQRDLLEILASLETAGLIEPASA